MADLNKRTKLEQKNKRTWNGYIACYLNYFLLVIWKGEGTEECYLGSFLLSTFELQVYK